MIGDNVRIEGGVTLKCASGYLKIGSYINIGDYCHLTCSGGVILDDVSGFSQGVRSYSASSYFSGKTLTSSTVPQEYLNLTKKSISIGVHVVIGSGSVVLPGVFIAEGSTVGALLLIINSLDS